MGWGVDEEDTISNQLARLCGRNGTRQMTFINGGVGGAGPYQELGMLEKRGLALQPDRVILQLFLFNDLDDCLMTVGKSQRCFYEEFHRIADNLRKANIFPDREEYLLRIHSAAYYQLERNTAFNPWAAQFLSSWRFLPAPPALAFRLFAEDKEHSPILDINRAEWYPELQEGADLLVQYVERIHNLCAQRNIPFAVYCMPDRDELDDTLWSWLTGGSGAGFHAEKFRAIRKIEDALANKGITTFSVAEALERQARAIGIGELYYLLDGHATAGGNEVVAQRIHEILVSEGYCN
jgi:lysophospholipase L1-like esterase